MSDSERPIGIFDSGIGGLTVFKEVSAALPAENIVYLGEAEQYLLKAGDTSLKALTIGAPDGIGKGARIQASFGAEHALLLPSEGRECA